jgi:phosphate transport system protein
MEPHYTFHIELQNLNKKLLKLTALVEDRVRRASTIIETLDQVELQSIILSDYEIDELEVEIEEDCLKILALHQPVASDLRFIIAVIKINAEMERIADMAVNIALCVDKMASSESIEIAKAVDFSEMSEKVIVMLKMSLDALITRDAALARRVFMLDDEIDNHLTTIYETVTNLLKKNHKDPGLMLNLYMIARHLERLGDRTTNISEEVIYLVEGVVTRTIS